MTSDWASITCEFLFLISSDLVSGLADKPAKRLHNKIACNESNFNCDEGWIIKTTCTWIVLLSYPPSIPTVSQLTIWCRSKIIDIKTSTVSNFRPSWLITAISVLMKANLSGHNAFLNRGKFSVQPSRYNGPALELTWTGVGHGISRFTLESVPWGLKADVTCCRGGVGLVNRTIFRLKNFVLVAFWELIEF